MDEAVHSLTSLHHQHHPTGALQLGHEVLQGFGSNYLKVVENRREVCTIFAFNQ